MSVEKVLKEYILIETVAITDFKDNKDSQERLLFSDKLMLTAHFWELPDLEEQEDVESSHDDEYAQLEPRNNVAC